MMGPSPASWRRLLARPLQLASDATSRNGCPRRISTAAFRRRNSETNLLFRASNFAISTSRFIPPLSPDPPQAAPQSPLRPTSAPLRPFSAIASHTSSIARPTCTSNSNSATPSRRFFSGTPTTSFLRYLWAKKTEKCADEPSPKSSNLPPLATFIDGDYTAPAAAGRLALKGINEPRIRCTEFDVQGNVTLVNGEFKKSELIAKYGLLPRDLRKIDSSLLPHILVRPSAILINLLHLRVLIKHDRVLVFDAYGSTDSYTQSLFMYDLTGKLRQGDAQGSLPYEFRALESVLISVTTGLESEFEGVREPVVQVLRELEEDIDRDKLRYLLVYSKRLSTFEQTARLVRDALDEILEADDDLAAMYLTEKANGKGRSEQDHTEVEMLLESYHKVTDEIVQAAENLVSSIRNTEEIIRAILDSNRNSLMLLELRFSIWTLGIGAGTFIAALYGMNLKNFFEDHDLGFAGISAISTVLGVIVLVYGLHRLRRIQRVSMWGGGSGDGALGSIHHHPRRRAALDRSPPSLLGPAGLPPHLPSSPSSPSSPPSPPSPPSPLSSPAHHWTKGQWARSGRERRSRWWDFRGGRDEGRASGAASQAVWNAQHQAVWMAQQSRLRGGVGRRKSGGKEEGEGDGRGTGSLGTRGVEQVG